MMPLTSTAFPAANADLSTGVLDSIAWRAIVAFFSPHWARMLISMPEISPFTAGEHGNVLGAEGTKAVAPVVYRNVVSREMVARRRDMIESC